MRIEVEVRKVYGVNLIYPVNEPAKTLCALVGNKTLNVMQLALARQLGLEILEVVPKKLEL